jgi:hypothetical protein
MTNNIKLAETNNTLSKSVIQTPSIYPTQTTTSLFKNSLLTVSLQNELLNDAELLESSTKKNDKYTVRRILDVHYSHFRIKPQNSSNIIEVNNFGSDNRGSNNLSTNSQSPQPSAKLAGACSIRPTTPLSKNVEIPSIFFNILHLAIEYDSIDVLRICLKYGLDPNEPGTCLNKISYENSKPQNDESSQTKQFDHDGRYVLTNTLDKDEPNVNEPSGLMMISEMKNQSTIRYPIKCMCCLKKKMRQGNQSQKHFITNDHNISNNQNNKKESITSTSIISKLLLANETCHSYDNWNTNNSLRFKQLSPSLTTIEQVNYGSYSYLVRLSPIFLAVSKCNHQALELLLTYDACSNVQDDLGNTPLHLAVAKRKPCFQCVYLLLKYHAKSLVFNNRLQSPYSIINQLTKHNLIEELESNNLDAKTNLNDNNVNSNSNLTGKNNTLNNTNSSSCTPNILNSQTQAELQKDPSKWNYSIIYIHSLIIFELFENLDIIGNQTNIALNSNTHSTAHSSNDNQRSFLGAATNANKTKLAMTVHSTFTSSKTISQGATTNKKTNHQSTTNIFTSKNDSVSSLSNNREFLPLNTSSKFSNLKSSLSQLSAFNNRNLTLQLNARKNQIKEQNIEKQIQQVEMSSESKRMQLSTSLKNIAKIKNLKSTTSLSDDHTAASVLSAQMNKTNNPNKSNLKLNLHHSIDSPPPSVTSHKTNGFKTKTLGRLSTSAHKKNSLEMIVSSNFNLQDITTTTGSVLTITPPASTVQSTPTGTLKNSFDQQLQCSSTNTTTTSANNTNDNRKANSKNNNNNKKTKTLKKMFTENKSDSMQYHQQSALANSKTNKQKMSNSKKSKSLINVANQTVIHPNSQQQQGQLKFSKSKNNSPLSVQKTLNTQLTHQHATTSTQKDKTKMNKQKSLSSVLLNKVSHQASPNNVNNKVTLNNEKSMSSNHNYTNNESKDGSIELTEHHGNLSSTNKAENSSVVSSKISLFKKAVSLYDLFINMKSNLHRS